MNVNDLLAVLAWWGEVNAVVDVDDSGIVDVGDLLVVLARWGLCPP
ncbi:MAG: hypothetical protein ACYTG1_03405 [Planctomycetota bacterium]